MISAQVADYDANCGRQYTRRRKSKGKDSDDDGDAAAAYEDAKARADEKKLQAYITAANASAKAAAEHAAHERRDADGTLSDALEATVQQKAESDARMTEWPAVPKSK